MWLRKVPWPVRARGGLGSRLLHLGSVFWSLSYCPVWALLCKTSVAVNETHGSHTWLHTRTTGKTLKIQTPGRLTRSTESKSSLEGSSIMYFCVCVVGVGKRVGPAVYIFNKPPRWFLLLFVYSLSSHQWLEMALNSHGYFSLRALCYSVSSSLTLFSLFYLRS